MAIDMEKKEQITKTFTGLTEHLKLKLLAGLPIEVPNVGEIKPKTLKEIINHGYDKYVTYLNFFSFTKEDFIKSEYLDEVKLPLFTLLLAFSDDEFKTYMKEAIHFFTGIEVEILLEQLLVIPKKNNPNFLISSENFEDFRQVIRWQNGLDDETNPTGDLKFKNDRTRKIAEKLKKSQAEVDKQKRKEGKGDLDFSDIVSAIASKSFSLNKITVFDLTMYQVYDEYKRLDLIDNYQLSIQAMMLGAKGDNLKHWSSKI